MRVCKNEGCNNTIEKRLNDNGICINNRQTYCDFHSKSSNGPNAYKSRMYNTIKNRCAENGREFVMTWDGFLKAWPTDNRCPVFGFELVNGDGGPVGRNNSPSVDRIDSSKGYTDDNIQIISKLANSMKQNATEEELYAFAEWILKGQGFAAIKLYNPALSDAPVAIEGTMTRDAPVNYNMVVSYGQM